MKTKDGKWNEIKVEKYADLCIEKLNSFELSQLVSRLIEYQDGAITGKAVEFINRNKKI